MTPARRSSRVALLCCVALLSGGCTVFQGVQGESQPRQIDPARVPASLLAPRPAAVSPSTSPGEETGQIVVYLVEEARRIVTPVVRTVPKPINRDSVLHNLFEVRPTPEELANGLVSAIPSRTQFLQSREAGGLIVVDLDDNLGGIGSDEASLAAAQLVFTVTREQPASAVEVTVNGQRRELRTADGKSSPAVTRADFRRYDPGQTTINAPTTNAPTTNPPATTAPTTNAPATTAKPTGANPATSTSGR